MPIFPIWSVKSTYFSSIIFDAKKHQNNASIICQGLTTDTTPLTTANAIMDTTATTASTSTNAANDINDILVTNTDKPGEAEDGHPTLNEDGNPSQAHTLSSQPNPVTTYPQVRTTSHYLSTS